MTHFALTQTDSTSSEARRRLLAGEMPPFALSALRQTAGRGRQGRAFFSPEGGVYLTVALPTDALPVTEAVPLTVRAAVSVAESIEAQAGLSLGIKWVNDLYFRGKKVAGILAEAVTDPETGRLRAILVGVGINLTPPPADTSFPDDLSLAGGLFDTLPADTALRERLTTAVAQGLFCDLMTAPRAENKSIAPPEGATKKAAPAKNLPTGNVLAGDAIADDVLTGDAPTGNTRADDVPAGDVLTRYRQRSTVLGKDVVFWQNGTRFEGHALDIDEEGALLVLVDGERRRLTSGEITLRTV